MLLILLLSAMITHLVLITLDFMAGDKDVFDITAIALYTLTVMMAFLAPAFGSKVRADFDQHPLLAESFSTSLGSSDYAAALHRQVIINALLAMIPFVIFALFVISSFFWAEPMRSSEVPFRNPAIRTIMFLTNYYEQIMVNLPMTKVLAFICFIVFGVSFFTGFYLHQTLLLSNCSLRPRSQLFGLFRTVGVVLAIMVLFVIRFGFLANSLNMMIPFGEPHLHLLILIAMESVTALARIIIAQRVWKTVVDTEIQKTKMYLIEPGTRATRQLQS